MLSDADPEISGLNTNRKFIIDFHFLILIFLVKGVFDTTMGEFYALKKYKNLEKENAFKNYIKGKLAVNLTKEIPDDKIVIFFTPTPI